MKLDEAIAIAQDCEIGLSGDGTDIVCLHVLGRGIEIKDIDEVKVALDIRRALRRLAHQASRGSSV